MVHIKKKKSKICFELDNPEIIYLVHNHKIIMYCLPFISIYFRPGTVQGL